MNYEYYDQYINKETEGRYDVTPIFEDPDVYSNLLDDLIGPFRDVEFDKIAGLEALGFIVGGALAQKMGVGFICIRKGGKLPGIGDTVLKKSFVDYSDSSKSFEINKSSIKKGDKILVVDEWIETGSQMKTAVELIERLDGVVVGISSLVAHKNENTEVLFDEYDLKSVKVNDEM